MPLFRWGVKLISSCPQLNHQPFCLNGDSVPKSWPNASWNTSDNPVLISALFLLQYAPWQAALCSPRGAVFQQSLKSFLRRQVKFYKALRNEIFEDERCHMILLVERERLREFSPNSDPLTWPFSALLLLLSVYFLLIDPHNWGGVKTKIG